MIDFLVFVQRYNLHTRLLHVYLTIVTRMLSHCFRIYSRNFRNVSVKRTSFIQSTIVRRVNSTVVPNNQKMNDLLYKDILQAQGEDSCLIIDVREQHEIDETGKLPGSIHIPMGDVVKVLTTLSEQEFKHKFNKEKPKKETKIILSCRSGKRSKMIQEDIQKVGYENAYNYVGGWLDWESQQKNMQ